MQVIRGKGGAEALRQAIQGLQKSEGRVGWFPSAVYEGGQPVAGIAAVHEFGSSNGIPPRPFMRPTAEGKRANWAHTAEIVSRQVVRGALAPSAVMEAVCQAAEGDVRQAIIAVTSPALKAATVAARKRALANGGKGAASTINKPLVHTGLMLNSLTSEVDA